MMKRLSGKESTIKLLHGTSSKLIESIFEHGLLPQGLTDNTMFNYTDYGRKGVAKHVDCVYLTNDLENAIRYANNAVKHKGGFPIVMEVEVDTKALTWDDDAFYKNYGDFDFGEKDEETGEWIRKPKKPLWEQSLDINTQCAHHGKIERNRFKRFYINSKWIGVYEFIRIYNEYDNMKLKAELMNEKKDYYYKDFKISLENYLSLMMTIIDRNIFFYNLTVEKAFDKFQKPAFSLALMEFAKDNLKEFGAKIFYTSGFKQIGFNPKNSSLGYAFGRFEINTQENIMEYIELKLQRMDYDSELLTKIIKCEATDEEFDSIYEYSVDFAGDLIEHCKNVLEMSDEEIIDALKRVKQRYNDAYNELDSEIEYLLYKKKGD